MARESNEHHYGSGLYHLSYSWLLVDCEPIPAVIITLGLADQPLLNF